LAFLTKMLEWKQQNKAVGKGECMDNARSIASRFSGLLLFVLSLAVVGVLVFLTIRSARDQDQNTADQTAAPTESQAEENAVTDDNGRTGGDTSSAGSDNGAEVAADIDGNLPDTGPESAVLAVLALGALAYAGNLYFDSRHQLKSVQRR
jgi:hypothetical protein